MIQVATGTTAESGDGGKVRREEEMRDTEGILEIYLGTLKNSKRLPNRRCAQGRCSGAGGPSRPVFTFRGQDQQQGGGGRHGEAGCYSRCHWSRQAVRTLDLQGAAAYPVIDATVVQLSLPSSQDSEGGGDPERTPSTGRGRRECSRPNFSMGKTRGKKQEPVCHDGTCRRSLR